MGYHRVSPTQSNIIDRDRRTVISEPHTKLQPLPTHPLLNLQQRIGNRAVAQMLQAKMSVGKPNDAYEQEADRVADTVMRMPEPAIQRQEDEMAQAKPQPGGISSVVQRQGDEKEETAQAKPLIGAITPLLQREPQEEKKDETAQMLQRQEEKKDETAQMLQRQEEKKDETAQMLQREENKEEQAQAKESPGATPTVSPHLETRIQTIRKGGQALDSSTQGFFESRFGHDFSGIRVHTDSQAAETAGQINAQAFTVGRNIFFGAGKYEPHTSSGKWLLAHELTHTLQQQPSQPIAAKRKPEKLPQAPSKIQRITIQRKVAGAKAPSSPAQDLAFQAVINKAKAAAKQQKSHAPAQGKATEAQAAAVPPANDRGSKAAGQQVQQMDQQQPKAFNRNAFKAALLAKIAATAPKNLKEADEFKSNGKVGAVKGELTGQVESGKQQSGGAIADTVKGTPNPSGIEAKAVTPLPPNSAGAPPGNIDAAQATPKPKTAGEVSLQAGSQSIDQQMADANVTDEQLKKSNEPNFQSAADAKQTAQKDAVTAPQAYRQGEQAVLTQAQSQAVTTAKTQLTGMHAVRGQAQNKTTTAQQQAKNQDEQKRTEVANELQTLYTQTKKAAEDRLTRLDTEVNQAFDQGATAAQQVFEDYVQRRMDAYKDERYSGISGAALWVKDKFLGLPSEVNAFYQEGRQIYIKAMDGVLDRVATMVEKGLNEAKAEIAKGRKAVQAKLEQQPANLRKALQQDAAKLQGQFDQLEQSVEDKQNQLIDSLTQKYNEKLQAIDARIDEMKAANRGLVDAAMDAIGGVIKTILELKDMLLGVLGRAAAAINKIIKDPIGFLGNLVAGVKQGFMNFVGNIGAHLQKGLMGWLFGAVAEAGIQLPDSFDLKGIMTLVLQVLGATWAFIRARAVKILGEKVVKALETTAEIFMILATKGIMGVWEYIQEQLSSLKDTVIEGIKSFVTESIIKAGVTWILGLLNPAGAFIKACKAIYDVIMFFVERGSQIIALVNAVVDSVSAIADGAIGVAASAVENALSKALPVAISFLAALLGVTGISKKIQEIIKKVQAPVSKAIDWLINKAVSLVKKVGKFLGLGKKDKKSDPEHDKKVQAGLNALHQDESKYAKDGKLGLEDAKKVAANAKRLHPVFKSITVIDGGSAWKYHYVASPAEDEPSKLGKINSTDSPVAVGDKVRRRDDTWSNGVVDSIQEIESGGQKQKRVFILLRKSRSRKGQSTPGKVSVTVEQLTKDFATNPDSLGMGGYAKGYSEGIPEHSEYEPKKRIETKIEGGSTQIKYETAGGTQFEAVISADQMTHKISGTKLKLKRDLGIEGRGITQDSPGFIANANLNRSHLIADLFLGSGYKNSANLVSASSTYNNVEMGGVEDQIVKLIKTNKAKEFDLSVTAKLGELKKAEIVRKILSSVPAEEKDAVKESVEQFVSRHPSFKVILEVSYQITLVNSETNSVVSIPFNLGPDKYLKV
jgi:hypothetical protein